jgi:hypothetical protein
MTDYMESIADPEIGAPFNYEIERETFLRTFAVLAAVLEDKAFGWVNRTGTIVRGFAVYHFEAFALGVQPFLDRVDLAQANQVETLRNVLEGVKRDPAFQTITSGGGRNSKGALDRRIGFVQNALEQAV